MYWDQYICPLALSIILGMIMMSSGLRGLVWSVFYTHPNSSTPTPTGDMVYVRS